MPQITSPQLGEPPPLPYPDGQDSDAVVSLKLLVNEDGTVGEVEVLEGEEPFAGLARAHCEMLVFSPALVDGVPRAAWVAFRVEFRAPVDEEPSQGANPSPKESDVPSDGELPDDVLESDAQELEVTVRGTRRPGATRLISDSQTRIIPGAEGDPLRALEAFPGIVPILASGPFLGARGASPGMVGYEYDGISVPYLFHLARGKAVVNPWLVDGAALYGSGGPASMGRALGGTIAASAAPAEGRFRAHGRVLTSDSELGVEAPLLQGKGNILLAGRYSYTQLLVSLIAPQFSLNYWDYQGRLTYRLNERDSVEFLSFGAGDHSAQESDDGRNEDLFRGSFHRVGLRFRHDDEDGRSVRVGLIYGHDRWDARPSLVRPRDHSVSVRLDVHQAQENAVTFSYGTDAEVHFQTDFRSLSPRGESVEKYDRTDLNWGAWSAWQWQPSARTTVDVGLRLDFYFSSESSFTPSATAVAAAPRFSLSHEASEVVRLHNSVGMAAQRPSPAQRPPGRINSVSGGLERSVLSDAGVELSFPGNVQLDTTVFLNTFFNVADVEDLRFLDHQVPDQRGQGGATGLEVLLRRSFGRRFSGFAAYTLSHSWRSVGRVRSSAPFDRRHVADVAGAVYFDEGWTLTTRATYYTGFPARVSRVSDLSGAPRSKSYFQLDWQVEKRWVFRESGRFLALTLGVLNTTLSQDANGFYCGPNACVEELVGPATVPTVGLEGEL